MFDILNAKAEHFKLINEIENTRIANLCVTIANCRQGLKRKDILKVEDFLPKKKKEIKKLTPEQSAEQMKMFYQMMGGK